MKTVQIQALPQRGRLKIELKNIVVWAYFILTAIGGLAIAHGDSSLAGDAISTILTVVRILCVSVTWVIQLFFFRKTTVSLAVFVPLMYFFISTLNSYSSVSFGFLALAQFVGFLLLDLDCRKRVFVYLKIYLVIMSVLGIIAYIASLLSLPIPYETVPYYNQKGLYYNYGFSYIYSAGVNFRLCGLFNEPGYFGTIIALVLCADKLNLRKKENLILFAAGCMTVSMAFVLILVAYLCLMCFKRPKLMVLFGAIAVFYFFILPEMTFEDSQIAYFVKRFTFQDGTFAGDSRSNEVVDNAIREMFNTMHWTLGYGGGYSSSQFSNVSTYKTYLLDYGLLGFLLLYGSYLLAGLKCAKKSLHAIFFCLCFFLSIYQRPGIFELMYYVVLFGGIEYMRTGDRSVEVVK